MKLLAIDTATEACSAALYQDGVVDSRFEVCPQQHSQKILPMVDDLLKNNGLNIADIDYLVFGRGPGSFTGVRIATGIVQGLSLGSGLKVVGISTLAAMAQQAFKEKGANQIAVATDARMNEVYFAEFSVVNDVVTAVNGEHVLPPEQALNALQNCPEVLCGTGWQAYDEFTPKIEKNGPPTILYPNAAFMFDLAMAQISAGDVCDPEDIEPVYLRDKVTWKKLPGKE